MKRKNKLEQGISLISEACKGISLIEILVVIGVFAILGVLSTRIVLLSLQGSKKGDSQVKVRENIDYAVSVIERNIRNAESITPCPNLDPLVLTYLDSDNISTTFSCITPGALGYIASGSARLTGDEVAVTSCTFSCTEGTASTPPEVGIDIVAVDAGTAGSKEGGSITVSTKINLRTY